MRLLFTALAFLISVSLSAQVITYPYNPDADNDSLITLTDMLDILALFGNEFIPEPVLIDGMEPSEWVETMISMYCNNCQIGEDIYGDEIGTNGEFASSMSMNGDGTIIAVGNWNAETTIIPGEPAWHGSVRVFEYQENQWSQLGQDILHEFGDCFGYSVSINNSGDRVVIGDHKNDYTINDEITVGQSDIGRVVSYDLINNEWQENGIISGNNSGNEFGKSVSMNFEGNRIVVGAPNFNDDEIGGYVRVFEYQENQWIQIGSDITSSNAYGFGENVGINNDGYTIIIGASGGPFCQVYNFENNQWSQVGNNLTENIAPWGSYYNSPVVISGNGEIVAYGHALEGNEPGYVRVFSINGNEWQQMGSEIEGEEAGNQFGYSLDISEDGLTLAIGARENDGENYYQTMHCGHVRILKWDENDWIQYGEDIDGDYNLDYSGSSVTISNEGTKVAIGAPGNDGGGEGSGQVRIFSLEAPCPN